MPNIWRVWACALAILATHAHAQETSQTPQALQVVQTSQATQTAQFPKLPQSAQATPQPAKPQPTKAKPSTVDDDPFGINLEQDNSSASRNPSELEVRALVSASNSTTLSTQIDGVVNKLPFEDGQSFKKGDTLVTFDCREYEVNVQRSKAALQRAIDNRKNREQLARLKSIGTLEVALSKSEEAIAKADLSLAEIPVGHCRVKAPYNGKVIQTAVHLFQFVARGTPLIEILDDSSFEIKLIIPSAWLSWLKIGYQFDIVLDETSATHKVKISRIGSKIDSVSQTISVDAKFIKQPRFVISGMSGTAIIKPPKNNKK